ncbi:hypothetical protein [Hydrogenophaga taeniospiralis]|uniref:hypothetical protein n=1 Tax=Hydrogenophaga taeniospiralis TaxID=65656 RepID=UPI001CFA1E85|nr:hypothetical protein [Hydrogenophaga taeniospiralis]UCU93989.1 hypothetical protein KI616_25180 [Hydrogenophaga taeniospiralis]
MGRTATETQAPAAAPAMANGAIEVLEKSTNELVSLQADQASKAIEVARQIGYEGAMTVGALEDEIRFYQRRTVEAILETGKRLLVLKELTPHGEFKARVDLLGISYRTAARFMQASAKTAKSANLALLSTQIKSASSFLELITHDDDVLDGLQEMDDFDRMSASQLRQAARELQADLKANAEVMAGKDRKLNEQARKAAKFSFETDWPAQVGAAVEVVDKYASEAEKFLGIVMQACSQAMEAAPKDEATQQVWAHGAAALAARVRDAMARQKEVIAAADAHFASTLGLYLED